MALADEITHMELGELHPDSANPRLPPDRRHWPEEDELLVYLADQFEALVIAESVARHGYYPSEPLIVTEEDGRTTVLEGNRRLTALLGLARPDLAERFRDAGAWSRLEPVAPITGETPVPVLVAEKRSDADALIGFRHIGGVLDWKPLQRARYVAYLIDEQESNFLEVAETVGEEEDIVRMLYRNQSILGAASHLGRPDLLEQGQERFGTYTAALNRNAIREWVGARTVRQVHERRPQLQEGRLDNLAELFGWLFGEGELDKVIAETRELTLLAEVIRDDRARQELRLTRDLYAAYALTPGPPKRLLKQFAIAIGNLRAVSASADLITQEERAYELAAEGEMLLAEIREAWANENGAERN